VGTRRSREAEREYWLHTLTQLGRCAKLGVPVELNRSLPRDRGLRAVLEAEAKFNRHLAHGLEIAVMRSAKERKKTMIRDFGEVLEIY
jgi:hypothetical protein